MSSRSDSLSSYAPSPSPDDAELVSVTRGELRRLVGAASYLLALAEHNDASDPGDEPDDLVAARDLARALSTLVGAAASGNTGHTGSSPQLAAGVTAEQLTAQLGVATGDDGTRTRRLVDLLAREGRAAADDLLSYGLYVANPHDVAALLLCAAAKRHAGA